MDCDDEPYGAPQYLGCSNTGESGTLDARSVFRCGQCCLDDYGHNLCFDDDSRPFLFLWWYGGPEEYYFHHFAELYRHGCDQCDLGCGRIQSGLWRRFGPFYWQSADFSHVYACGSQNGSVSGSDHPFGAVCPVSDEVCHYHPLPDYRFFCRAGAFLGLSGVSGALFHFCLLSFGPLDLASRRFFASDGGARFCRRNRGACFFGSGSPDRSVVLGPA